MNPIEKMTVKQFPELIVTIIVIQQLQETLNVKHPIPFWKLEKMTGGQLFWKRDELIHLYQSMTYVHQFQN